MSNNTPLTRAYFIFALVLVVSIIATYLLTKASTSTASHAAHEPQEEQPLYWVAPMDANYRRDKPGKSPMGMDLVPVFASGAEKKTNQDQGTITLDPNVINTLGVRTDKANLRTLQTVISTVGYVEYDEEKLVHIHPRVEGWVEKLHVKAYGDPVKKGQALYTLYSPQLVNAQEELILALKRNNKGLISAAEGRLKALQVHTSAINQLKKDRKVRQSLTFHAPQSGFIDNLNVREGFYVKPATLLMSVSSLREVWINTEINEREAGQITTGQTAHVTLSAFPDRQWTGTVDFIYPSLDPNTRTLKARLRFKNPDAALKPNMFAQVSIEAGSIDKILTVPKEAVIRTGNQNRVVLAKGDGHFKSIEVELGHIRSGFIEITKGLSEGEEVVTSAQFLLDSESSKTSDFARMDSTKPDSMHHEHMHHDHMNHDEMNHDEMNHDEMNHDEMNHDEMNHDEMNHDEMNHDGHSMEHHHD